MIEKAKKISQEAHKSQIRRFDGSPYFVHPNAVAEIVSQYKVSKHIKLNKLYRNYKNKLDEYKI